MFFFRRKDQKPARPVPKFTPRVEQLDDRLTPVVVANPDAYQVGAGQVLTIPVNNGVLVNDFDDEDAGAILSATVARGAQFTGKNTPPLPVGTLNLSPNGSFTFIAPSNFDPNFGNVTFDYRVVNRDTGTFAVATVTINIAGVAGRDRLFAIGPGPGTGASPVGVGQLIRVFDSSSGVERYTIAPYEATFTGGIRVATGDLNRDGVDDIVTAPAVSGSARIKIFDGKFGSQIEDFFVFEPTFRGGADVAIGDVNGDQFNDLIVGAGEGGGPRVVAYDGKFTGNLTTPTPSNVSANKLLDFFAYESTFRNGVRVAAGDIDGLTRTDPIMPRDYIVTGTFAGGGPAVRVFDGARVKNALQVGVAEPAPLRAFFAFDPNGRNGVNVAVGQFRTDGKADIVAGTGGGFSTVRVFDGRDTSLLREFSVPTTPQPSGGIAPGGGQTPGGNQSPGSGGLFQGGGGAAAGTPSGLLTSTGGGAAGAIGGVRVGVTERNGDGLSDIITGLGPGVTPTVRIFDGNSLQEITNFLGYRTDFNGGVFVGGNSLT